MCEYPSTFLDLASPTHHVEAVQKRLRNLQVSTGSKRQTTGAISHSILVFRIRRVKCDERTPDCLRCASSGRVCDGYLDESRDFIPRRQLSDRVKALTVVGPVSRALRRPIPSSPSAIPPAMSAQEYMHFDLFRSSTAVDTDAASAPSGFWSRRLLQMAHGEPAVWHAALALGALHRRWDLEHATVTATDKQALTRSATAHYGRAMAMAASLDARPEALLALSLALTAAANMFGFWKEAHTHMLAGMRLLEEYADRFPAGMHDGVTSTLVRMDLQSMTYSDSSAAYPFDRTSSLRNLGRLTPQPGCPLESYSQATGVLFALIRRLVLADQAFSHGRIDLGARDAARRQVIQDVTLFEHQMAQFEAQQPSSLSVSPNVPAAFVYVRIYHAWMRFLCRVPLSSSQLEYDNHLGYFERVIVLCHAFLRRRPNTNDRMVLSLEPAVIVPLFDTAKRCRHPQLRRLALKLLKGVSRHEGMWRSDGAAAAAQVLITVEEGICEEELSGSLDGLEVTEAQEATALWLPWNVWSCSEFEPPCTYAWAGSEAVLGHDRIGAVMVLSFFGEDRFNLRLAMATKDLAQPYGDVKDVTLSIGS